MDQVVGSEVRVPLCRDLARQAANATVPRAAEAAEKIRVCVLDYLTCALESRDLPISRQAIRFAALEQGRAPILFTDHHVPVPQAAFANAVMGHGLVREDMHTGSVSHLGVVIMPTLLALATRRKVSGRAFVAAAILGYEAGGRFGRSIINADFARLFRPTGFTGPVAGAIAGAHLMGLDEDETTSALSLAVNTLSGLNEWPATGSDEMFFHPGFAARNAVTAVDLARFGARASETVLDGSAGFFSAYRPGKPAPAITLFPDDQPEILAVYNKPVPACNYAQTPCQTILALAREDGITADQVASVEVRGTRAMKMYPGCDYAGPFGRILQAKMSIQFGVAAALLNGGVTEENYRKLEDPQILDLAQRITVTEDAGFNAAYPALQGAAVDVTLKDGRRLSRSLADVVPATPAQVRARFQEAGRVILGAGRTAAVEKAVDELQEMEDVTTLLTLLSGTDKGD
ncbi:MAG TPA: MmgE/PrpD family protein [Candidatus Methylacidiphilales bacterium]|jgi:2-methylcitrate dehydratase PrpD|nr:MmgE/PrpD family protein [Candidatus Methylacidiphilales bacterium]